MKVDFNIGSDSITVEIDSGDDFRERTLLLTPTQALDLAKCLQDEVRYYRDMDASFTEWSEGRPAHIPQKPKHRRDRDCPNCQYHAGCEYIEGGCDGFIAL